MCEAARDKGKLGGGDGRMRMQQSAWVLCASGACQRLMGALKAVGKGIHAIGCARRLPRSSGLPGSGECGSERSARSGFELRVALKCEEHAAGADGAEWS